MLTLRHFVTNLIFQKDMPTLEYPEQKPELSPRFRGRHRLKKYEDGRYKCTACMLCATACPAKCIHIEAAEYAEESVEKYPERFDIDLLHCVYCGMCEEACPCDSIYMDTGIYAMSSRDREDSVIDLKKLAEISEDEKERNL
jgi:NADH-quinone oxidoreductase subunit I